MARSSNIFMWLFAIFCVLGLASAAAQQGAWAGGGGGGSARPGGSAGVGQGHHRAGHRTRLTQQQPDGPLPANSPHKRRPHCAFPHTPPPPGAAGRKLLQGWPEPPINVQTPEGPLVIRRYPFSVQNIVGLNVLFPNPVQRGRGSGK